MRAKKRAERRLDAADVAHASADDNAVLITPQPRQTPPTAARRDQSDLMRAVRRILPGAAADDLVEIIARANAVLPDTDPRKVRRDEVDMLRRLANQARAFNATLVEHAAERRAVGERRRPVSPESAKTAAWAGRLADALESVVRYES